MPAWITVYMRQVPKELTPEGIKQGIRVADWWTLGEDFGISEDTVDDFMRGLRWGDNPLRFGQEGQRPVQVHLWTDSEHLQEEIAELELGALPVSIRSHLGEVRAIVALEIGFSQLKSMVEVVAFEIAYWLAETYEGLIHAPDESWYDHDVHRWDPIEE